MLQVLHSIFTQLTQLWFVFLVLANLFAPPTLSNLCIAIGGSSTAWQLLVQTTWQMFNTPRNSP